MDREAFIDFISREENEVLIKGIKEAAVNQHDVVCNQKYGNNEPYSYHLNMVAKCALDWCHMICNDTRHIIPIIFGAYFHDAIEDARMTYNDVFSLARTFMNKAQALIATEIVYALTDEKGRNRAERGSEKHYMDIRNTLYAPFVNFCDRYANYLYSIKEESRMVAVYNKEMPQFIERLGGNKFIPDELLKQLTSLQILGAE